MDNVWLINNVLYLTCDKWRQEESEVRDFYLCLRVLKLEGTVIKDVIFI